MGDIIFVAVNPAFTRLAILISMDDTGKINLPEEMLTREGALNEEEWQLMREHPEIAYRITMATEEFSQIPKKSFLIMNGGTSQVIPRDWPKETFPY